jgi:hypothetical protein
MTMPIVPMPAGIQVMSEGLSTILRRRWWSWTTIPLLFFCIFWNGFMAVWFTIALSQHLWPMAAFGSLHAVIGVGLAYSVLASLLNATDVLISPEGVRVRIHPIPWRGNLTLDPMDISQLYTKQVVRRQRNGTSCSYEVHVIDRPGRERTLVSGLTSSEQGLFIEQTIEYALGITDRPVRGEIPR